MPEPEVIVAFCAWRGLEMETHRSTRPVEASDRYKVIYNWNDSLIPRSRSVAASAFLRKFKDAQVLFFIDSDIEFTMEHLNKVADLAIEKKSIAGGVYPVRRQMEPWPAIRTLPSTGDILFGPGGSPMKVAYVSTGFMAIHRSVLEDMAKILPWCVRGPGDGIWPFFTCGSYKHDNGDWEYLSEDWMFCQWALNTGRNVWMDSSVCVGHIGTFVYRMEDAAGFGSCEQDRFMVVEDLADYMGKEPMELAGSLLKNPAKKQLADAWEKASPQTSEEVDTYYKSQESYIYDLAWFNVRPTYWTQVRPLLKLGGRVADFGGGIGSLAMALGRRGCEVAYIDLPSPQRTFAEWRFAKHDYLISVHDSLDSVGEADSIVSTDTIEHIHPDVLPDIAEKMFKALRSGGQAYTINKFSDSGSEPQHFTDADKFKNAMHEAGFEGGPMIWTKPALVGD